MIKARHNFFLYPFFQLYTSVKLKSVFSDVMVLGEPTNGDKAVLVVANHFSWWDGFWIVYLNSKVYRRKFFFMMLEEQLKENWFFRFTGGYSIKKGSREILESLDYTSGLLDNNENLVLIFPQGEIKSMHSNNIVFQKGIERILQKTKNDVEIVFVANIIEYLSEQKPILFIHLETYQGRDWDRSCLESAYNNFYREVINQHNNLSI